MKYYLAEADLFPESADDIQLAAKQGADVSIKVTATLVEDEKGPYMLLWGDDSSVVDLCTKFFRTTLDTLPACCGICFWYNLPYGRCLTPEVITIVETLARAAGYGAVMCTVVDLDIRNKLIAAGFKEISVIQNPRTFNSISTMLKDF